MVDERLLTVKQVADQFGVRTETVLRWIKTGRIRGTMPGGTRSGYRIPSSEVARLLSGEPAPEPRPIHLTVVPAEIKPPHEAPPSRTTRPPGAPDRARLETPERISPGSIVSSGYLLRRATRYRREARPWIARSSPR